MRVAIVEDDPNLGELLTVLIQQHIGHPTLIANGWQAMDELRTGSYDMIILDIMLPGLNGLEICRQLRAANISTPILMLTSKSEDDEKVAGLEMGADDYLTKPFSNKELIARIKSIMRRLGKISQLELNAAKATMIGDLTINPQNHTLTKGGLIVDISPKEFELLQLFMEQAGRSFTRQELLERVWGEHFEGLEHTVNATINRLRAKIEEDPSSPKYLVTIWGVGYRFNKSPL